MNRKIWSALLAALLLAAPLTSCNLDKDPADTTAGSTAGTSAAVESQTAIPRYDYMSADVAANVTLDRAAYTNLTLTVPNSLKVDAADVQDYINNIRFQYRTAKNGTTMVKDQPLQLGDDAYIYYKGFLNGEAFDGGSNWDDASPYKLGLGSGSFIPGFEEALVGVVPNTTSKQKPTEITVTFPEDYTAALAGKEVVFQIAVEYAVQYTMSEYNRDFVENTVKYQPKMEFYGSDAALLEEFEAYVHDYLVTQSASSLESAKSEALWEYLLDAAIFENLPAVEIEYYRGVYRSEAEYYYEAYASYNGEQFLAMYPTLDSFAVAYFGLETGADWQAEVNSLAAYMVQRDMLTHAVAEWEGLETVTEEEMDAQIQYWIQYYAANYYTTMTESDILASVGESFLAESALSDKINDWLLGQVAFTYEDGTPVVTTTETGA